MSAVHAVARLTLATRDSEPDSSSMGITRVPALIMTSLSWTGHVALPRGGWPAAGSHASLDGSSGAVRPAGVYPHRCGGVFSG